MKKGKMQLPIMCRLHLSLSPDRGYCRSRGGKEKKGPPNTSSALLQAGPCFRRTSHPGTDSGERREARLNHQTMQFVIGAPRILFSGLLYLFAGAEPRHVLLSSV